MANSIRTAEYQNPSTDVPIGKSTPKMPSSTTNQLMKPAPPKVWRSTSKVMNAEPSNE